jgi:hypothetical protein
MTFARTLPLGAVLLAGALGCRSGGTEDARPAAQIVDTTNSDALDGLSSQEVSAKAEALTPEQAAARGIAVDTTIHVENLSSQDSTPPGASTPAPAPGRTGTAPPTDSVRPRP